MITSLSIIDVRFSIPKDMLRLIESMPNLASLELAHVSFSTGERLAKTSRLPPVRRDLTHLKSITVHSNAYTFTFLTTKSMVRPESLCVDLHSETQSLDAFLSNPSSVSRLQRLCLMYHPWVLREGKYSLVERNIILTLLQHARWTSST